MGSEVVATRGGADQSTRPENYRRALVVFTLVVSVFVGLVQFPSDDVLRHVGLAFGEPRSWGEVYPHSVFSENLQYNPWWGYDRVLRGLAAVIRPLGLPHIVAQTVVIDALSIGFLAAFLLLAVQRSGLAAEVRSRGTLAAAAALIASFLSLPIARVLTARPFVVGSLYLLFALSGGGALRGMVAAGILGVCYPYLFWVYTLPVAAAHLWRGDRRFGFGTLALTVAAVAVQPRGFWGLLEGLARSDGIRATLNVKIQEFKPITAAPSFAGAVILALLCVLPFLPAASRRMGVPHLLMIFFVPAAVKFVRYVIDVELVLLFVICSAGLIEPVAAALERIGSFWLGWLRELASRLGRGRPVAEAAGGDGVNLRPAIAVISLVLVAVLAGVASKRHRDDAGLARALEAIPKGSLVLTEFNLQYRLLFVRPDLQLVPSCELGFPSVTILADYRRFFDEGDPCGLAKTIDATWYVGPESIPLDPTKTACLGRKAGRVEVDSGPAIALWRVGPG